MIHSIICAMIYYRMHDSGCKPMVCALRLLFRAGLRQSPLMCKQPRSSESTMRLPCPLVACEAGERARMATRNTATASCKGLAALPETSQQGGRHPRRPGAGQQVWRTRAAAQPAAPSHCPRKRRQPRADAGHPPEKGAAAPARQARRGHPAPGQVAAAQGNPDPVQKHLSRVADICGAQVLINKFVA